MTLKSSTDVSTCCCFFFVIISSYLSYISLVTQHSSNMSYNYFSRIEEKHHLFVGEPLLRDSGLLQQHIVLCTETQMITSDDFSTLNLSSKLYLYLHHTIASSYKPFLWSKLIADIDTVKLAWKKKTIVIIKNDTPNLSQTIVSLFVLL